MSAERLVRLAVIWGLIVASSLVAAEDAEAPDLEFLEYLGLWDESDEDWLLLDKEAAAENEQRSEPVPEGEDSTETEDET